MTPSQKHLSFAICVATNRAEEVSAFLAAWAPYLRPRAIRDSAVQFSVFIHEDHPRRAFDLPSLEGVRTFHTSHADIDEVLGAAAWIIPRKTGASRSFPMYQAWKAGADFVLTMDDDCLPPPENAESFFETHLEAFRLDRWFRTIDGETPRGIPYGDKGALPVLVNHGIWTGIPDLDGPTALVRERHPTAIVLRAAREVIPPGMYFPLCAMNVCYRREAIPAAYNLLMGLEDAGFDRFDDIWSGLFIKRIADHLGHYITNGIPFVRHAKASNLFANLRKEALGIHLHEDFWKHVSAAPMEDSRSVLDCYRSLARWTGQFPKKYPQAPAPKGYFERLAEAMVCWTELFDRSP
jgi:hypothetical protein